MGYAIYQNGGRYAGYGVPAYCEHPGCDKKIDRGVSYACGQEPFKYGCDRYFCGEHVFRHLVEKGCVDSDDCEDDECCVYKDVCQRCKEEKSEFDYKPEHPDWIKHLLKDESWKEWRENNPESVKSLKKCGYTHELSHFANGE